MASASAAPATAATDRADHRFGGNLTDGLFPDQDRTRILWTMDPNSDSEELPALYRAILDRVGQLEARGDRETARAIRAEAIRIYSRSWNAKAKRQLESLLRRSLDDGVRVRPARAGFRAAWRARRGRSIRIA